MLVGRLIPWRNKMGDVGGRDVGAGTALSRFHSEVDRLFERFFEDPFLTLREPAAGWGAWAPALDVSESESEYAIRAELPGVEAKDLEISVTGDVLVISGEKKEESEERKGTVYRAERRFGSFRRSISLPESVDASKVSAEYGKGVLTIRLPKSGESLARRIPVSVKK
jgi:HSP20 family protein